VRKSRREIARGMLFYLTPTIIFFSVEAIGLWRLPGDFW
jgi:thioredoxin-related protein